MLVLAADHYISDSSKFRNTITIGKESANQGKLVTFGIKPTSAETGYGYIEVKPNKGNRETHDLEINRFIEKPSLEEAKILIKDNKYLWNSGIFLFKATVILQEIKKYHPMIYKTCKNSYLKKTDDLDFQRIGVDDFKHCPDLSIDYAVMEKTKLGTVIKLDSGWSDIGSWDAL